MDMKGREREMARTKAEQRAYLKEINKRTDEEVRQMHQDWIDNRDKTCEVIAKAIVSKQKGKERCRKLQRKNLLN